MFACWLTFALWATFCTGKDCYLRELNLWRLLLGLGVMVEFCVLILREGRGESVRQMRVRF